MPTDPTSPKPTELLRFRISDPVPLGRFQSIITASGAEATDTVRHYNGALIIERPAADEG